MTTWRNRITGSGEESPDQLLANPRNFRRHPKHQQDALRGVLNEVGWVQDVIVNRTTGHLVDGHLRVELALRDGAATVPVKYVELSEAEEALILATFDPISALATADRETLDALLREVSTGEAAVQEMLGELAEREGIIGLGGGTERLMDADEVPDPPATPRSHSGDRWLLGRHTLWCGDGRELIVSRSWGTLVVDPPWDAIDLNGQWASSAESVIAFTDGQRAADVVTAFGSPAWVFTWDCISSWYTPNRPLRRGKLAFWYGNINSYRMDGAFYGEHDGGARTVTNSRGSYVHVPDPRGKHLSDVFSLPITKFHSESEHHHAKPVDWVRMLIGNCGGTGDIGDPFAGSGTSLIAAEQLGLACHAAEIDPAWCDVIVRRWEQFTGQTAVLERREEAA
jgi:hypothetical protein